MRIHQLVLISLVVFAAGCRRERVPGPRTDIPELDVPAVPTGSIVIDGQLLEAGWAGAAETGPFVAPGDGSHARASPVAARARLLWDQAVLYVAIEVDDDDAESPFGRDSVDPHIWAEASGIEVMLQPGDPGDNRHYYEVQVDVAGAVWDTRFDDYNQPVSGPERARRFGHQDWSAQLHRAVHRRSDGYTVEMALPWVAMQSDRAAIPPQPGDVWRLNLYSFRDGQSHALAWSALLGEGNFHRSSRFGRIRFVE